MEVQVQPQYVSEASDGQPNACGQTISGKKADKPALLADATGVDWAVLLSTNQTTARVTLRHCQHCTKTRVAEASISVARNINVRESDEGE